MVYPKHQIGRGIPSESGVPIRPKEKVKTHTQGLLEDRRLDLMLRMEHELVRLTEAIGWAGLAESFVALYPETTGRPGIPIRTMAGLVMLQHTFGLSDEQVVSEWPGIPDAGRKYESVR